MSLRKALKDLLHLPFVGHIVLVFLFYKFEADGAQHKGNMQWVNLQEHPEIKEGATVPIYYLPSAPDLSHWEHQISTHQIVWIANALCATLWIWMFWKAARIRKKTRAAESTATRA